MNDTSKIEILPEDKVNLTQDQINLLELAFAKQIPPGDAEFVEKAKNEKTDNLFSKLIGYFVLKYGPDFGLIYLSAITGGQEKCEEAIASIENIRATERLKKQKLS